MAAVYSNHQIGAHDCLPDSLTSLGIEPQLSAIWLITCSGATHLKACLL